MKFNKFILFIFILNILFSIKIYGIQNLNIETDNLKESTNTYSSLTDIYKINIFTDDSQKKLKEDKKIKNLKKDNIINNIFSNRNKEKVSAENFIKLEGEKHKLFMNKKNIGDVYLKKIKQNTTYNLILIPITILFCLITVLTTNKHYKSKKKKENKNADYSNYKV